MSEFKNLDEGIEYVLRHTMTEALVAELERRAHDKSLKSFVVPGDIENNICVDSGEDMPISAKDNTQVRVILLREYAGPDRDR